MAKIDSTLVGEQIAALPLRQDPKGRLSVLMITSRETRRWVMPKGWTMDGKKPWDAAKIEALDEAGAEGRVGDEQIGIYHYDKVLDDGALLPCRVVVYPMLVRKLKRRWKERSERKRRWFSPKGAAKRVDEPELAALLRQIVGKADGLPPLRALLDT